MQVLKHLPQHNPVATQRFGADPWAMVVGDRVYLYMTGDEPMSKEDGGVIPNHYGNINTIRVLSSDDLVNWRDHGSVAAAGPAGAARWANNSWAPAAAHKVIGGQERFFLYFANSGGGIGVLTADSPTGPFVDPLGRPLVSRDTPTCASIPWLFDPAVLVDEDGQGYLYFGGGIPQGREADPGSGRVVRLGADMISLDGDPVPLDAPWLFEDSGINRFGDTYVYSYCSNFCVPPEGSREGFWSGEIVTRYSSSPMGPFHDGTRVLKNPGAYFGVGGNNHHCMFRFHGRPYIAYHAATVDRDLGWNKGYRSTFVDALCLDKAGLPTLSEGTMDGVEQLFPFDPYRVTPAATAAAMAGVETVPVGVGEMAAVSREVGAWIAVAGVDFDKAAGDAAGGIVLDWQADSPATLELVLDGPDAEAAARFELSASKDGRRELFALPKSIAGTHDLYFRFPAPGVSLRAWEFVPQSEVVRGPALLTASDFPDPDVIRVGDTYYMASTTMHFSPGCALLKSRDLLRWEWCGHIFDLPDDERALKDGKSRYGRGMWAPSLRWHDGIFAVCFASVDTGETHIYQTRDIEHGPWTRTVLPGIYHDPSLFFDDDGRVYIVYGNNVIKLTELEPDLSGVRSGGLDRVLAQTGPTRMLGYEGSHFYKINGRYLLFVIHSLPDRWRRVESAFASDSLTGEFRGGLIFNDDMGYCGQGVAQGGIVDTPDGRWYAVLFQDRGAVGRVPVLLPLAWEDGFPVLGRDGKVPAEIVSRTTVPGIVPAPLAADDGLEDPSPRMMWEWNHAPSDGLWKMGGGTFTLTTGRVDHTLPEARNTLTTRCFWPGTEVTVTVDGARMNPGDCAGLCALQFRWCAAALRKTGDGYAVSLLSHGEDGAGERVLAELPASERVVLRAVFDFRDMRDTVAFSVASAAGGWIPLGEPQRVTFDLRHFAGVRAGLFCYAEDVPGGSASFREFRIRVVEENKKAE